MIKEVTFGPSSVSVDNLQLFHLCLVWVQWLLSNHQQGDEC